MPAGVSSGAGKILLYAASRAGLRRAAGFWSHSEQSFGVDAPPTHGELHGVARGSSQLRRACTIRQACCAVLVKADGFAKAVMRAIQSGPAGGSEGGSVFPILQGACGLLVNIPRLANVLRLCRSGMHNSILSREASIAVW